MDKNFLQFYIYRIRSERVSIFFFFWIDQINIFFWHSFLYCHLVISITVVKYDIKYHSCEELKTLLKRRVSRPDNRHTVTMDIRQESIDRYTTFASIVLRIVSTFSMENVISMTNIVDFNVFMNSDVRHTWSIIEGYQKYYLPF